MINGISRRGEGELVPVVEERRGAERRGGMVVGDEQGRKERTEA